MQRITFLVLIGLALVLAQDPTENPQFGKELGNIPFDIVIGGPLTAVIDAQAASARSTMNFINEVAFRTDPDNPDKKIINTFTFKYSAVDTTNGTERLRNYSMEIPLLTMMPIPNLQFDTVSVEFNVKLNSIATKSTDFSLGVETSLGVDSPGFLLKPAVTFKITIKSQFSSKSSGEVKREYSLNIKVIASQAPIPAGTERILDLMDSIIREGIPEADHH